MRAPFEIKDLPPRISIFFHSYVEGGRDQHLQSVGGGVKPNSRT